MLLIVSPFESRYLIQNSLKASLNDQNDQRYCYSIIISLLIEKKISFAIKYQDISTQTLLIFILVIYEANE